MTKLATLDAASTALAVASTAADRLAACEALAVAAEHEAIGLRAAIAKATAPTAQQLIDSHRTGDHALRAAVEATRAAC